MRLLLHTYLTPFRFFLAQGLVTDDPIQDVGAPGPSACKPSLRVADKAAKAEKRLKSYGRVQPLGVRATASSLPPPAVQVPQPQESLVIAPPPLRDARPQIVPD